MVDERFVRDLVREVLPAAEVHATDLTGTGDHWHVVVVDASFEGQRSFKRQRIVMEPFKPHIRSDAVHALDLVCLTPQEAQERAAAPAREPFRPHGP